MMKPLIAILATVGLAGTATAQSIVGEVGNWTVDQTDITIIDGEKTVENSSLTECWPTLEYTTLRIADLVPEGCSLEGTEQSETGMSSNLSCVINGGKFQGRVDARRFLDGQAMGWSLSLWSGIDDDGTKDVISSNYSIAKRVGAC